MAQQLSLQQSSLDRAQEIVTETEYYVETSNRWIRGRTWAGWITNLLTSPPLPPSTSNSKVNQSKTNSASVAVGAKMDDYSRLYELGQCLIIPRCPFFSAYFMVICLCF